MIITSKTEGNINGTILKVGTRDYPEIDHTDKATESQLRTLRDDVQTISFAEILEGDRVKELRAKIQSKDNKLTESDVIKLAKDATRIESPDKLNAKPEKVEIVFKEKSKDIDWDAMANADAIPIINRIRAGEKAPKAKSVVPPKSDK